MSAMKYGTYNDFQETSSLLHDSARLAQEADAVGAATVEDLQGQGDKLRESRGHLASMREMTDSARESLKGMRAKAQRKKLYLWIAMISLGIANVLVIIQLARNHGSLWSREEVSEGGVAEDPTTDDNDEYYYYYSTTNYI